MIRTRKRMTLCICLLIFNVAFIWINSMLPRAVSSAFSRLVGSVINFFFPGPDIPPSGGGHGILRKIAHLTEFCCLGMLLHWLAGMLRQKRWEHIVYPLLAGIAVAALDETIQCFNPGRGPGILDVCIDTLGVTLGVLLVLIAHRFVKRKSVE